MRSRWRIGWLLFFFLILITWLLGRFFRVEKWSCQTDGLQCPDDLDGVIDLYHRSVFFDDLEKIVNYQLSDKPYRVQTVRRLLPNQVEIVLQQFNYRYFWYFNGQAWGVDEAGRLYQLADVDNVDKMIYLDNQTAADWQDKEKKQVNQETHRQWLEFFDLLSKTAWRVEKIKTIDSFTVRLDLQGYPPILLNSRQLAPAIKKFFLLERQVPIEDLQSAKEIDLRFKMPILRTEIFPSIVETQVEPKVASNGGQE